MNEFHLEIVTPDGIEFEGMAQSLLVKCESGDVEILARHTDYFGSLGIGRARIKTKDGDRFASCAGGFLSVSGGKVRLIATTFEFAEDIDLGRAEKAKALAEARIAEAKSDRVLDMAKAKLQRALSRISVANMK